MSRILITGSSKGLGRATALELARRGHEVIATARKVETLADLPVAQRLELDVTNDASVQRAVKQAGRVDVLINNAAEIVVAPLESTPFEEVRHLYETNVFGALRMIQGFTPAMRERGSGTVVNISSVVGRVSLPLTGIYSSTKWALEALSEALRLELGHFGVRVVVVEPGQIGTGALDAPRAYFGKNDPYLPLRESRRFGPREEMTPPETIARIIADAVEAPEQRFRWPAGPDAEALLAARAKLDDPAFDTALRSAIKLQW
ncbi:SDR family oxidoreductase [Pyxidicoccus parkwayensis]|uniref:SDR family oxidoreductase n=1 Tax=Pyxidicoccus parkwayensis TaxID=2813578 RepID=A0ABX7NX63_9BACT|nr:SDR family oxidoreductase [Pyxidicoccus parkwaysis]QSQ23505.1 SDR family oxidoreductase [Pyxidicoccus parkwaysis]